MSGICCHDYEVEDEYIEDGMIKTVKCCSICGDIDIDYNFIDEYGDYDEEI